MRTILALACVAAFSAAPAAADVFLFETPSGNIQCSVGLGDGTSDIECAIVNRSGPAAAPRPSSCTGAWGHRFLMLGRGPVQATCGRPQDFEIAQKAPYGQSTTWGNIRCTSETSGLTCLNADGHGFFLSRRSQRIF